MYGKEFVDERLERAKNYKAKDKMQLVAKWCAEDCQKNYSTRKKNGFNDFMQNNYDFDELEKILEQTPKINDDG